MRRIVAKNSSKFRLVELLNGYQILVDGLIDRYRQVEEYTDKYLDRIALEKTVFKKKFKEKTQTGSPPGVWGHWAFYCTRPKSFTITFEPLVVIYRRGNL